MSGLTPPDTVDTGKRYATIWRRLWAILIDLLVLSPIYVSTIYTRRHSQDAVALTCAIIAGYIFPTTYSVIMHARYGQTLGKMAAHVKVMDVGEQRIPSLLQAILMNSYNILDIVCMTAISLSLVAANSYSRHALTQNAVSKVLILITNGWTIAEVVCLLLNRKRRAAHDYIAGTVVVRTDSSTDEARPGLAAGVPVTPELS